jgi:hypothetical protein
MLATLVRSAEACWPLTDTPGPASGHAFGFHSCHASLSPLIFGLVDFKSLAALRKLAPHDVGLVNQFYIRFQIRLAAVMTTLLSARSEIGV